jgi:ankyrin repeat protein
MMNADGAFGKDEIIAWDTWLNRKQLANEELINAIQKKDAKAVANVLDETMAKNGCVADSNVKLMDQSTPLHCAVQTGTVEIVDLLLKHFAEVNAQDEEGITPLHLACISGNLPMVKKLISRPEISVELKDS